MCGIKTASLFSMRMDLYVDGCEKKSGWNRIFRQNGTVILPIQRKDDFMLFFVYNPELIKARLAQKKAILWRRGLTLSFMSLFSG